ncbi:MAG TPA: hypothetical protein VL403_16090 [Candidatus Kryptonia bacterium]|nr:hypothetical protein [Candidatus Kryptonia bacterium]
MNPIAVLGAIVALGVLYVAVPVMLDAYRRFRGTRLLTCPETHQPVAIELNATHAALRAIAGENQPAVEQCSRWPVHRDCGQECLSQIQDSPDGCRVRTLVTNWYEGRSCVLCGVRFATMHWLDHRPALWSPEGTVVEWSQVATETLPQVLSSHAPLCWNCSVAELFRATNPGLVIDRPAGRAAQHP